MHAGPFDGPSEDDSAAEAVPLTSTVESDKKKKVETAKV